MSNPITYRVALENASHEAIVRQAYKDSVGVWTWSVGLTNATGHTVTRYKDKPQTMEHCLRIYVWALNNYADAVRAAFKGIQITEAQFAAALSFHWNTGAINKASWVGMFKRGDMVAAEKSFKSWNKAGGREIAGLTSRRAKEADLLFRGKWSNNGTITEYTRVRADYTPDWSSAKRVNIEADLRKALGNEAPATVAQSIDKSSQQTVVTDVVVADPGELEQSPAKSKTTITWAFAGIGAVVTGVGEFFGGLDWRVQIFICVVIAAFAVYGIKRRFDLAKSVRDLKDALQ